ncbi:phosphoesterase [Paenibacillus flagellatus]|uniref:Phosphoesterase n=2 Tax=Paenibacillus flagellatus TaxID=2211139 RepID=A0A2V5K2T2_9BACL|nr:phosphoesterase [Paenibacillus flagellatus]
MPRAKESLVRTFRRDISREEQGTYIEIPFAMPEGTETLRIAYAVESRGEPKATIDLGVRDAGKVRGWSGGARSECFVGREKATPGYTPGELTPGEWAVLHNAYRVPEGGCTVTVTVECEPETPRWLKGDLHMHSVHSDGTFTLLENAAVMEELGCDFLAMTDHNTTSQNAAYPRETSVVLIPGMEFTTNRGHANLLGVPEPLDDFRVAGQDDVDRNIRTARERGARVVLNHPHCRHCPWLWDFSADIDWVEVWNGPWSESNEAALDWWHRQLASGRRLVAVGGSDTHRPHPYVRHAMPTTWVYARTKTVNGILEGIARGHVSIGYAPDAPFLELACGPYRIGDAVPANGDAPEEVELRAERLLPGDVVRLIGEEGTVREWTIGGEPESGPWPETGAGARTAAARSFRHPVGGGLSFLRAEVRRHFAEADRTLLAAMTNPIYFAKGEEGLEHDRHDV